MSMCSPPPALTHSFCLTNASHYSSVCQLSIFFFLFHPTQAHHKIFKQILPNIILLTQHLPCLSNSSFLLSDAFQMGCHEFHADASSCDSRSGCQAYDSCLGASRKQTGRHHSYRSQV